ncbi:MAG: DEAD/DEAH box helicase family protein [Xanthobacteraceae bacterium]|nr:DEAD/DEAH box helicase family protein [Xanthobacteraceae bacterium]MCW5678245.1 DEAD/DEAH box helicase family protein [Xanthobacteraceae bacterium]
MIEPSPSSPNATFSGDLASLAFKTEYRSLKEEPAKLFYRPCLLNSSIYKRAVGYFRSSVYLVIGPSVVEFARRGGKVSIICSPELSDEDIDGIAAGYAQRSAIIESRLIEEIDRLLTEPSTSYQTQILATLISVGALDLKLALRSDKKGIYHEKIGIFRDGMGNAVSFKGSANETWSGWHVHGNFESIEVFCSWRGGLEASRVQKHEAHFDALWTGKDAHVEVFPFPVGATERLKRSALKGLDAVEQVPVELDLPVRKALAHQSSALEGWRAQGSRGIFEHATGSGKTFTAILAIREHVSKGLPALVLVPSKLLLEQWALELRLEVPQAALLLAGAGNTSWKKRSRLAGMTNSNSALGGRIVLATMPTAASDAFRQGVVAGDHLMLVADEVHQVGSPENSKILQLETGPRLGLSATPTRYGDPIGTANLMNYFGSVVPPPITLADAVRAGRLVPYEYYPHAINLTATESEEWKSTSKEISLEMARQNADRGGKRPLTERAKLLLIQRARIAKKASKKIELARQVLTSEYAEGQHWLIYCEDSDQLSAVVSELSAAGLQPTEYHSTMQGDREATLSWFRSFGGPLVSIRCLDEGVDIPAVSHALILASSQNPRQFIQRRGRVLRASPGKTVAVLHDAIVVPTHVDDEPEQTALLEAELARAIEFAAGAINLMAGAELRAIAAQLGMNTDNLEQVGVEEDDNDE